LLLSDRIVRGTDLSLIEPTLRLAGHSEGPPQVALTLDACDGGIDERILDALILNEVPATVFISGRWLARN
jgi:peptidoglycan/xylan/chitin deacetylase (PgdA/CDA1 family)